MTQPIWSPSAERIARANTTHFIRQVALEYDDSVTDYASLHRFSVDRPAGFYEAFWRFFDIAGDMGTGVALNADRMHGTTWFPQARFNFAENLLRDPDESPAIVARAEAVERSTLSRRELYDAVSRAVQALTASGIRAGDRVAAVLPNIPEAIVAALAVISIGAIWSSCAPDLGERLIIDRFGQIEPKLLIVADGYRYDGKVIRAAGKTRALQQALPTLERTVIVPFADLDDALPGTTLWDRFLAPYGPQAIAFARLPFEHPLWILYSSGTTGKPKAIVHSNGGSLIQALKSIVLDMDLGRGEPVFFYTSTGWMVWNVMLGALAWNGSVVLYDGSPSVPNVAAIFDIINEERVAVARLVPALIDLYAKADVHPNHGRAFAELRCLAVAGAPLLPHHYDYIYTRVKSDLHVMSPAGGTDILGSFVTGNPTLPVYAGEIQAASLGMSVEIFDENGRAITGRPGELVCTKPFPSMPLGFWGDGSGERYRESYFAVYPDVWRQGDWAEKMANGGFTIFGRADATLNVNGSRIGTGEIYRCLEGFHEVREAVAVTHRAPDRERIVLFVVMNGDARLNDAYETRIRTALREGASSRHVPAKIVQAPDLPRSANGKSSEIAVRDAIHGRLRATGIINPEALEFFRDVPELRN